jgi:hypothetical protein
VPAEFAFVGEYYSELSVSKTSRLNVSLPNHDRCLDFKSVNTERRVGHSGPWHFVDVARMLFEALVRTGEDIDRLLCY